MSTAGTPAYMAPEMLARNLEELDIRTDVYLLGSVLHEILTGTPPHRGNTIMELLGQICTRGNFKYAKDIPSELANICNRAMSLFKQDRFQSVREFHLALEQFLTHRESYQLVEEGIKLLEELEGHLALISPQATTLPALYVPPEEVDTAIYALFWRCHFGFKQALRIWKNSQEAKEGMQRLLEAMIQHELNQKDLKAAETLLGELPIPNDVLAEKLDALRQKQEQKAEALKEIEQIRHDQDAEISANVRRIVVLVACGLLCIGCLAVYFLERFQWYQPTHKGFMFSHFCSITFLTSVGIIFRTRIFRNKFNYRMFAVLMVALIQMVLLRLVYMRLGFSLPNAAATDMVVLFGYATLFCITVDLRMLWTAFGYLSTGILIFAWPGYMLLFLFMAHALAALNITQAWNFKAKGTV